MSIRKEIIELHQGLKAYDKFSSDSPKSRVLFASIIKHQLEKNVPILRQYVETLEKGECEYVLGLNFEAMTKFEYWLGNSRFESDMMSYSDQPLTAYGIIDDEAETSADLYHKIVEYIREMIALLERVKNNMKMWKPELYEQFFFKVKPKYKDASIEEEYERRKGQQHVLDMNTYIQLQAQYCADYIKSGVFEFANTPSQGEVQAVCRDYLETILPHGFVFPDDFNVNCAKFEKFISIEEGSIKINYPCYGKFICDNYYNFTEEQRREVYKIDMVLSLIHQDMAEIRENTKVAEEPIPEPNVEEWQNTIIRQAIIIMRQEKVLTKMGDYGLIMTVMNQSDDLPDFETPQSFVTFLQDKLLLDHCPSQSSVRKMLEKMRGKHPKWTFTDTTDKNEVTRRNNVGNRFLSLYRKQ